MRVLQPGIAFDFETVRYIFIYFFILLNKHFGSITTRLGFDFHWKNPPAQFFYNRKDVCKSFWHLFLRNEIKVTHWAASKREQLTCSLSTPRVCVTGWLVPVRVLFVCVSQAFSSPFSFGEKTTATQGGKKILYSVHALYLYSFISSPTVRPTRSQKDSSSF